VVIVFHRRYAYLIFQAIDVLGINALQFMLAVHHKNPCVLVILAFAAFSLKSAIDLSHRDNASGDHS
jgi:hypothetical protein